MLKEENTKITYIESPVYSVTKDIQEEGFLISSSTGIRKEGELDHEVIGILEPKEPKKILGVFKKNQRAAFLGTLWLRNSVREADYDSRWVLDVYGRDNIQKMKDLAQKISQKYNMKIQLRLDTELPQFESYLRELHGY